MDVKKIVLVGIVVLAAGYIGGSIVATNKAEDALDNLVNESRSYGVEMAYGDVSASPFGGATIDELIIDTGFGKVLIDELIIKEFAQEEGVLSEIVLSAEDISVADFLVSDKPKDLYEAFIYLLQQKGNEVDLDFALEVDVEDDKAELEEFSIEGDDIGEVRVSMEMTGLKKLQGLGSHNALLMGTVMLQELVIHEASVYLQDDGLLDTLLNSEATQKGVSADSLREKAIERGQQAKANTNNKIEQQLTDAGIALLEGDAITLTLDEDTPVSVGQLLLDGESGIQREMQKVKFDLDID
ncbi:hypothetical protein [uncultured Paraglaciecola sp.]|uniref:hypothetical protein n=1 Tax=uncultured Paraglaciecola sp. TaxID=1765024 RepID=UPI0030DB8AA4|tara:strand:+ start:4847 stop:5740 length:894 start_codon:yes stop_codon:yes gene_type:complete